MFTFNSIMFVSLGFLCALLLGFLVAPAFWARAVRLTTERMRASVPLTEREISAERDRLRAENAIRVHQLTAKIEQARLYDARQKVEINRRDGTISALQRRLQAIETEREGSENARRVLEATITQRVPEVETRLKEARQLLAKRDAEMKALQNDTGRTFRALDDAMQVNAQQRAEIDRLKMSLAGHGVRTQGPVAAESETALRAELEKLRARSREQAALIARLQGGAAVAGGKDGRRERGEADLIALKPAVANDDEGWDSPSGENARTAERQAEIKWLKAKVEEQTGTIEKLGAQLAIYEQEAGKQGRSLSLRDTKAALKARLATVEKDVAAKDKAIAGLRGELAKANERIARQASYYQDEFRRLGSRNATAGASVRSKGGRDAPRVPVADVEAATEAGPPPLPSGRRAADAASEKASLEQRLASAEAGERAEALQDFDQREIPEPAQPEPATTDPRGKLMDRIAGLAKR